MKKLTIDLNSPVGAVKPMHAINNAPLLGATSSHFHYLSEAKIPFSRLHDTGGAYGQGRFVDIGNVFRNFDADVDSPESYDFAFTDWLLCELTKQGVEPFYRLGPTIENQHRIKAYNIFPPKDNLKWAKICEHIIAHYNEGWADGFHMGIRYWEIWNEPDNEPEIADNPMWKGSFDEYIELYKVTAKHLKNRFGDSIKVGGYASCGFYAILNGYNPEAHSSSRTEYFVECFDRFMKAISKEKIPLDFFSWHSYSGVEANIKYARYARESLDKFGYTEAESIFNEWNMGTSQRGTLKDSSDIAANILALTYEKLDMLMYYDGQIHGSYQGLFNPITCEPFKTYYIFKAYSELYALDEYVAVEGGGDGIYCVAARSESDVAVMLTNRGEATELTLGGIGGECVVYRINEDESLDKAVTLGSLESLAVGKYETILIRAKRWD